MAVPQNYDDASLVVKVDPVRMFEVAKVDATMRGQAITDSIVRVQNIWKGLKLGWVGQTSDQADQFNSRWNVVMSELFGAQGGDVGILNQIMGCVIGASCNYGDAESTVIQMFQNISTSLSPGPSNPGPGDPTRHLNVGPITENGDTPKPPDPTPPPHPNDSNNNDGGTLPPYVYDPSPE